MRYVSAMAGVLLCASVPASEPVELAAVNQSAHIGVSLVVADPCDNTRHATSTACIGKAAFRSVENTQMLQPLTRITDGDQSIDTPWQRYRVRTIDFY